MLEVTGSLTRMGVVTALIGVGSLVAGIAAGPIVDRFDRRKLMIRCDLGRAVVYALVPIGWWLAGPHLWLVYAVTLIGSALAMLFGVAYITAVANLVERDQIVDATAACRRATPSPSSWGSSSPGSFPGDSGQR